MSSSASSARRQRARLPAGRWCPRDRRPGRIRPRRGRTAAAPASGPVGRLRGSRWRHHRSAVRRHTQTTAAHTTRACHPAR
eukprot:scaffold1211_cov120-Isochrysis_galbana.AAC.1